MIRTGWFRPERLGARAHTGITARVGRPIDSFAHHVRLARPRRSTTRPASGAASRKSLALAVAVVGIRQELDERP